MSDKRWVTVKMAAEEIGVSERSVWRWIKQTHEAQVPRETMRVHDDRGRFVKKTIVDVNALHVYADSI